MLVTFYKTKLLWKYGVPLVLWVFPRETQTTITFTLSLRGILQKRIWQTLSDHCPLHALTLLSSWFARSSLSLNADFPFSSLAARPPCDALSLQFLHCFLFFSFYFFIPYKHWLSLLMFIRDIQTCDYKINWKNVRAKLWKSWKEGIRQIVEIMESWGKISFIILKV